MKKFTAFNLLFWYINAKIKMFYQSERNKYKQAKKKKEEEKKKDLPSYMPEEYWVKSPQF